MTSLRTMEGLNMQYVADIFGNKKRAALQQNIVKWKQGEKVFENENHVILTKEGKLFADGIAADLFFID